VAYLDAFPLDHVGEMHLAGYAPETDDHGDPLLVDAHDRPIDPVVLELYERAILRAGAVPTLVEWDNDVPDWPTLHSEARRVEAVLRRARRAEEAAFAVAV
jgi:hypothetical protein